MADWSFVGEKEGLISTYNGDHGNAIALKLNFPDFKPSIWVPKDISPEEMANMLELLARALRDKITVTIVPKEYAEERKKWINKIREEEKCVVLNADKR